MNDLLTLPWRDPLDVFSPYAHEHGAILLHSQSDQHPDSNFSYICRTPEFIFSPNIQEEGDFFSSLKQILTKKIGGNSQKTTQAPFLRGFAGYLNYEAGCKLHKVPLPAIGGQPHLPLYYLGWYNDVLVFDHQQKHILANTVSAKWLQEDATRSALDANPTVTLQQSYSDHWYTTQVERTIEYIRAGDIYQANIAHPFTAALPDHFNAWRLFCDMAAHNPVPHAAYICVGKGQYVLSSSPERFLDIQPPHITTKPIKGTRPRILDAIRDQELGKALHASPKDRAENLMIVDLLRNDLSRVCVPGSVQVPSLCTLEKFPTVHHLVSTIKGELQDHVTVADILEATFPGGSITGTPKIRAMEIINQLEDRERGVYCGSIGWINDHGNADLNIAIRTATICNRMLETFAGCGITVDSDPQEELQESLDKVAPFKQVLEGTV